MASALQRPQDFCGIHFFNPVNRMPLVEIISGAKSSKSTIERATSWVAKMGKIPVVVKDSPGFLVNRLLLPYMNEAGFMMEEGVSPMQVDRVIKKFGMPMGPLTLLDEVGVDVGSKVCDILFDAFGERMTPCKIISKMEAAGYLGKKTGKGVYDHSQKNEIVVNSNLKDLLGKDQYDKAPDEEIVDRLILTMANEGAKALEEGVVKNEDDLDLAMIMGTGFPPFRGGVMAYARKRGFKNVYDRLMSLSDQYGFRFEPSKYFLKN